MSIRVGTSGFSFDDWKGTVYPENISRQEMLPYYERNLAFDALEVNYTYYRQPSQKTMASMVRRTGPGFRFVVKCYRGMTHEPRGEDGNLKHDSEMFEKFVLGVEPMTKAGRLGCILAQFPPMFLPTNESYEYLLFCKEALGSLRLVVEFRHRAWTSERTFQFLEDNGLGYCCVDEPKIPKLVPFVPRLTGGVAYFRFHGRNKNWFRAPVSERYNYLYSDPELEEFVSPIEELASRAEQTYVFFNNCHAGSAARNAARLKEMMGLDTGEEQEGQMELPDGDMNM